MASLIHSMGDNLEQMKPYENLVENQNLVYFGVD